MSCASAFTLELGDVDLEVSHTLIDQPWTITVGRERFAVKAPKRARLTGLTDCVLLKPVTIDAPALLTNTRFIRTVGLDQLRLVGDPEWPNKAVKLSTRQALADEVLPPVNDEWGPVAPDQLEVLYRQLRASLEASRSHAGANDFYWGELDARRRRSSRLSADYWLLWAYRLLLGYGVRATRPLTAWLATTAVLTWMFTNRTPQLMIRDINTHRFPVTNWREALAFVVQNSTNLLRSLDSGLQADGTLYVLFGRFLTLSFLAGVFLALRSRITR